MVVIIMLWKWKRARKSALGIEEEIIKEESFWWTSENWKEETRACELGEIMPWMWCWVWREKWAVCVDLEGGKVGRSLDFGNF